MFLPVHLFVYWSVREIPPIIGDICSLGGGLCSTDHRPVFGRVLFASAGHPTLCLWTWFKSIIHDMTTCQETTLVAKKQTKDNRHPPLTLLWNPLVPYRSRLCIPYWLTLKQHEWSTTRHSLWRLYSSPRILCNNSLQRTANNSET